MTGGEYTKNVITNIYQSDKKPAQFVNVPPLPSQALVGRDVMLAELAERLIAGENPALSTSGMPGVGKTALAVTLAHHERVLQHFDGGVLWAGLGREPDVAGIQASWATALGLDISDLVEPEQRQQAICNAIGQRQVLMVIDDAWELEPAKQLRCGGQVVCLLTTRDDDIARDFAGAEQNLHVPELEEDPSVELLRNLAPEAYEADPEAMRQLAQAVGGLPLALDLLGGHLSQSEHRRFPDLLQEALEALRDPRKRLELEKGRLDTVIALSLDQLQETRPDALPAFHALGAFAPKPARFQRAAAEAVAETDAATLALLIARNLLEGEGDSLALHQTLADAAAQVCPDAARQRHRDHYLALVDEDVEDWQRIERLYPQILHAWQRQVALVPDDEAVITFIDTLNTYQQRYGLWRDSLLWLKQGLKFSQKNNRKEDEAFILHEIGGVYSGLGEKEKALGYYEQTLLLVSQVEERSKEATTLDNIGRIYDDLGDNQQALDHFKRALSLRHRVEDESGEATTLNNIGGVYDNMGDKQKALDYFERALSLRRQVGDRGGEASTLNNIGLVYDALGDKQKALDYYEQALPLYRQVGDRGGEAITLVNIGGFYDVLGEKEKALGYFEQALPVLRQVGDRAKEAATLNNIGSFYGRLGDMQKALDYYEQALMLRRQVGDRRGEASTLNNIGAVHRSLGDMQKALDYNEQALPLRRQVGDVWGEVATLWNIGDLYMKMEELDKSEAALVQAIELAERVGYPHLPSIKQWLAQVQAKM